MKGYDEDQDSMNSIINHQSHHEHSTSQFQLSSSDSLNDYSDLLAQSGTAFLDQQNQLNTINNISSSSSYSDHSIQQQQNQSSSLLIDFNSATPLPSNRLINHSSTSSRGRSNSIKSINNQPNLMDHSISAFDLPPIPTLKPKSPASCRTPSHSPPPIINNILSTPAAIAAMSPLSSRTRSPITTISRTRSSDFLHLRNTPPKSTSSPFPRSKSSTAIRSSLSHHPELDPEHSNDPMPIIKSILRRPNSPSKGSRARFFSPRVLVQVDDQVGNESDLVDDQGHFRAREVVHEFEVDAPPSSCNSSRAAEPQHHSPRHPIIPSSATAMRRHHIPRFTIPEPAELDIEPILPRLSTSPSPSPPSLPSAIFPNPSRTGTSKADGSTSIVDCSTSIFAAENLSNIMDESGGFLGDDTTWGAFERSQHTERSIDLNHVAMMEVLGNKSSLLGKRSAPPSRRPSTIAHFEPLPGTEEETSVDMNELMQKMSGAHERSMNQALRDEPLPENMLISQDFSTTFEMSRMIPLNLPPLLTNQESRGEFIPSGHSNRAPLPNISSPTRKIQEKEPTPHLPSSPTSALARLNLAQQLKKDIPASPSRSPRKKASTTPSCTPVDENKKPAILEFIKDPRSDLITPQASAKPMVSKRVSLSIPPPELKKRDFGVRINGGNSRRASEIPPPTSAPPTTTTMCVPKRPRPSSTIVTSNREVDSSLMPPPALPSKKRVSLLPPGKTSGLGLGLPSSASYATTRMKPKPSTAHLPRGSPKVMKPRSSISSSSISNGSPVRKALQHRPPSVPSALSRPRTSVNVNKIDGIVKDLSAVKLESTRPMIIKKASSSSLVSSNLSKKVGMRPSISSTDLSALPRKPISMIKPSSSSHELGSQRPTSLIMKPSSSSTDLSTKPRLQPPSSSSTSIRPTSSSTDLSSHHHSLLGKALGSNGLLKPRGSEFGGTYQTNHLARKSEGGVVNSAGGRISISRSSSKLNPVNEFGSLRSGIPATAGMVGKPSSIIRRNKESGV